MSCPDNALGLELEFLIMDITKKNLMKFMFHGLSIISDPLAFIQSARLSLNILVLYSPALSIHSSL